MEIIQSYNKENVQYFVNFFDGGVLRNPLAKSSYRYSLSLEELNLWIEEQRKINTKFDIFVKKYQMLILRRWCKKCPWEIIELRDGERKIAKEEHIMYEKHK